MAQIKKKWKEIVGARNLAAAIYNQSSQVKTQLEVENKKSGAVTPEELIRNKEQIVKLAKELPVWKLIVEHFDENVSTFNDLREDVEIDFALTEDGTPKTALLRHEKTGSLKFTPEGEKKARQAIRELKNQEVFINILELPVSQKLDDIDFLEGFVSFTKKKN